MTFKRHHIKVWNLIWYGPSFSSWSHSTLVILFFKTFLGLLGLKDMFKMKITCMLQYLAWNTYYWWKQNLSIKNCQKVRSMNYTTCIVVSGNSGALACLKRHKAASFFTRHSSLSKTHMTSICNTYRKTCSLLLTSRMSQKRWFIHKWRIGSLKSCSLQVVIDWIKHVGCFLNRTITEITFMCHLLTGLVLFSLPGVSLPWE